MVAAAIGENQFGIPVEAVVVGPIVVTPNPNRSAVTFRTVTVAVSGTPVQGPSVTVPDGFALLIKNRSTQVGARRLFVANSGANTAVSTLRTELQIAEGFGLFIDDMDLLFFDSNLAGTVGELVAEQ